MDGWIKLHRKLIHSDIFQKPGILKLAIWCLLKAGHGKRTVPVKTGRGETLVNLKPGQFIFGRHTAARDLNMKPSSIRNWLQVLRSTHFLDTQTDTHYSIITIVNWDTYQGETEKKDNQQDNQRTTKGHKQECKEIYICEFFSISDHQHGKYQDAYPALHLDGEYKKMAAWCESNPAKRPKKSYSRFVNGWLSRAAEKKRATDSEDWRAKLKPI